MLTDFKFIFIWWLTIFLLSTLSLPLVFLIFKKFWDHGYVFAKTISIFLITYLLFVFGVFKILPFTFFSVLIVILLFLAFDIFLISKNIKFFKKAFFSKIYIFLIEELVFFLVLALWSYVRGFAPDIEGLEKFMDWGFVNSALRSQYFPPADMWYALKPINYYYFGHLVFALITKISNISSTITYNLSIATVCSLTFLSSFSLVSNIIFSYSSFKKAKYYVFGALLSAFLLTFGGNLHLAYKASKTALSEKITLTEASKSYWYPDATRFIGFDPDVQDKTIHEFPIYSFVVADLHGHMNDIPVVILFMAFLFVSLISAKNLLSFSFILPSAFLLSLAYMTNAWDFAVYGLLFGISSLLVTKNFWNTILVGLLVVVSWAIFTFPFSINFIPMAEGLKISDGHSPFYQLFVLYGGFWLICLPFLIFLFKMFFKKKNTKFNSVDLFVASLVITATILIAIPEVIYLKDIYIYEHRRANTMFKLVYQAFIMYSLASGYALIRLRRYVWYKLIFVIIFSLQLTYTYFAVKSYYGLKNYKGLYGLNFLKISYPDNLAAINWLNENVSGQPNIVEAPGDSYTTFNQISMATGLPTIQGWIVHEWLWRGGYDAPAARSQDVSTIYTSDNLDEVEGLLNQYQVKYIFVGDKEYEKYPDLNTTNFKKIGATVVFQSGQTRIYQLP
ncbi:hypothetical protein KKD37_01940 [Patescibacteria group bacterium]|nr:hypothetical protein [Patescibacteria group bacterium]